jgi:hypothetical protein
MSKSQNNNTEEIIKIALAIFLLLVGGGLIFTGIGIIGTFFLWYIAYGLLTK